MQSDLRTFPSILRNLTDSFMDSTLRSNLWESRHIFLHSWFAEADMIYASRNISNRNDKEWRVLIPFRIILLLNTKPKARKIITAAIRTFRPISLRNKYLSVNMPIKNTERSFTKCKRMTLEFNKCIYREYIAYFCKRPLKLPYPSWR